VKPDRDEGVGGGGEWKGGTKITKIKDNMELTSLAIANIS
jgi:hypothetical protein